jgi:hypothetical protein
VIAKRTIEELAVLYDLEPGLKEVFVEGPVDRAFVEAVLRSAGLERVQVNEIEIIDIPEEALRGVATCSGNRQCVVALGLELEKACPVDLTRRVCCVADADDEAGRQPVVHGALLLYTDFTSIELYAFSPHVLQRYLDQVVLGFPLTAEATLQAAEPVLREMALSRRLNRSLGLNTAPVDATDDCVVSGAAIAFDAQRFQDRFLNKAGAWSRQSEYQLEKVKLSALLPADPRLWVHGEDFVAIVYWLILRLRGGGRSVTRELLGKTLLLAVPLDEALAQPLFAELSRRLS